MASKTFIAGEHFEIPKIKEFQQHLESCRTIEHLAAAKTSDTCAIVGNGPSLRATDLTPLSETDTFISNFAFEHETLLKHAKYLGIVNHLVARQAADSLSQLLRAESSSNIVSTFAPSHLMETLSAVPRVSFIPQVFSTAFQPYPYLGASCQSTVTYFLLQIAYWIGYKRVLLIGVDNQYTQPSDAKEGDVLLQSGKDPNHFSNNYFSGRYWQAADTRNMAATYQLAYDAYRSTDREIINCTVGGALNTFPRGDFAAKSIAARILEPGSIHPNNTVNPTLAMKVAFYRHRNRIAWLLVGTAFALPALALLASWGSANKSALLTLSVSGVLFVTGAGIRTLAWLKAKKEQQVFNVLRQRLS